MDIYANGEIIERIQGLPTVTVQKIKYSHFDDFQSFTFRRVKSIIITKSYFNIVDIDFGTHTYDISEYYYHIK